MQKLLSLFYTILIPTLNPIIKLWGIRKS
jgi:hypothetical protein